MNLDIVKITTRQDRKIRELTKKVDELAQIVEALTERQNIEAQYLSVKETAQRLGVSKAQIYVLIRDGRINTTRVGRKIVIKDTELLTLTTPTDD